MKKTILNQLKAQGQVPCISILVNTQQKSFGDREQIELRLKNSVKRAIQDVKSRYRDSDFQKLEKTLLEMSRSLDYSSMQAGIGLFVAPETSQIVSFPLPIEELVEVADEFNTDAIEKTLAHMKDYAVLALSMRKTRLFLGQGNHLDEIDNEDFPVGFADEFQKKRSSPYAFYSEEESKIDQARKNSFFRELDNRLITYLHNNPIVLIGVKEHISDFKSITKYKSQIIAELSGNYDKSRISEINRMVWPKVAEYLSEKYPVD